MPPARKRRQSADKAMDKVMELLAKHGKDTSQIEKPEIKDYDYRSADAMVVFAHTPKHFVPGICKECKRPFAHNRPIPHGTVIGFCSDVCRRDNWKKTTGIPFSAVHTRGDIWNGNVPMVITADQYEALKRIADWFTEHRANLQLTDSAPVEPEVQSPGQLFPLDQDSAPTNLLNEPAPSNRSQIEDSTSLDDFFDSL